MPAARYLLSLVALPLSVMGVSTAVQAGVIPERSPHPVALTNPSSPPGASLGQLIAQATPSESQNRSESLRLSPQLGIYFETGPGTGYRHSFGSFYTFMPFSQVPLESSFFGEGRLNLFTQDEIGGNLRFGYRQHLGDRDLVWGSYVGYDLRHTEFDQTFHQIGLGADLQAQDWEVRLNGYLPIGDTRREVASTTQFSDTGLSVANLRFQNNDLLFDRFRQQTQVTQSQFEAAAAGVDLEGGYRLFDWPGGSLYGFAGGYYLNIPDGGSYVGVRGRLLTAISDTFNAGVSVSSDGNFGTNVNLQVGLRFGVQTGRSPAASPAATPEDSPTASILARLGQPVQRQETIAIDRQRRQQVVVTTDQEAGIVAINPATGQPWRFLHVTDGAAGGNGTFEAPFGEVTAAVNTAQTAGNDVVYVQAGDRSGMAGFGIPDNVQVLSTGVPQSLDVSLASGGGEVFRQSLPGSGTGTLPLINGTAANANVAFGLGTMVEMGTNSTLSGFEIQSTTPATTGVAAVDTSGYTITQNQIASTSANGSAIAVLSNAGASRNLAIAGNTVSTTQDSTAGILLFNATGGGTIDTVDISNNQVATTGNSAAGIAIFHQVGAGTTSNVTLSGNTIRTANANSDGLAVTTLAGTATDLLATNNTFTVENTTARGFRINTQAGTTVCVAGFTGNTLNSTVALPSDYDIEANGTVNFVDFASIAANNTNFNTGTVNPANSVTSVPGC